MSRQDANGTDSDLEMVRGQRMDRESASRVVREARLLQATDPARATRMLEALQRTAEGTGNPLVIGDVLAYRADWERRRDPRGPFSGLYADSLKQYRLLSDRAAPEIAACLFNLGIASFERGDLPLATQWLEQAIELAAATDQPDRLIKAIRLLARLVHAQGDLGKVLPADLSAGNLVAIIAGIRVLSAQKGTARAKRGQWLRSENVQVVVDAYVEVSKSLITCRSTVSSRTCLRSAQPAIRAWVHTRLICRGMPFV